MGESARVAAATTLVGPITNALVVAAATTPSTGAPPPKNGAPQVEREATTTTRTAGAPLIDTAQPIVEQMLVALSAERFKVTFTASDELRLMIEKARGLMRHTNPKGDLATLFECALKLLIAELEKRKFGKTSRPRKSKGPADPADVSREALRAVSTRDAEQCAFIAEDGARCPARELLEVDHRHARALGGDGTTANLR